MKSKPRKSVKSANSRKRKNSTRKAPAEKKSVARVYSFELDLDAALAPPHGC